MASLSRGSFWLAVRLLILATGSLGMNFPLRHRLRKRDYPLRRPRGEVVSRDARVNLGPTFTSAGDYKTIMGGLVVNLERKRGLESEPAQTY